MSGICDKCKRASCHARCEGIKFCSFFACPESNYEKLFGTPERVARTLTDIKCGDDSCEGCPIIEPCADHGVLLDDGKALCDSLLEWLRGDAE